MKVREGKILEISVFIQSESLTSSLLSRTPKNTIYRIILPLSYGYEKLLLTLRKEHKVHLFGKKISKIDEITKKVKILYNLSLWFLQVS
jgi:hypothetical protein